MKTEKTKAGLKVYDDNGKHVKTVPSKYARVLDSAKLDFNKKRLSETERVELEVKYFERQLKQSEPYVHELIQNSNAKFVQEVNNQGNIRFELVYENGTRLRITQEMYLMFPKKGESKFSNY